MGHTTEKVCALFLCNFMVKCRKGVYAMQVNGVSIPLEKPPTLLEFLNEKGYNLHRIAVERNEKIEAKEDYATIILQDSDVIEIVSFMGGGAC